MSILKILKKLKKVTVITLSTAVVLSSLNLGSSATFADQEFDANVVELYAKEAKVEEVKEYQSSLKTANIIDELYYTDILASPYHEDIVKSSVFELISGYGNRQFQPSNFITGYEVIEGIIRLAYDAEAVMNRVNAETGISTTPEQLRLLKQTQFLDEAVNRGIITRDEEILMPKPVSRERIAIWLEKVLKSSPSGTKFDGNSTYKFTDTDAMFPQARKSVERLVKEGILVLDKPTAFRPKDNMTRQEFANLMSNALEYSLESKGITKVLGLVQGIKSQSITKTSDTSQKLEILVRTTDNKYIRLISERSPLGAIYKDFITYKNRIASSSRNLAVGDEIEIYLENDEIRYVKELTNNNVLNELSNLEDKEREYQIRHFGTIRSIHVEPMLGTEKHIDKKIFRTVDVSGEVFDIVVLFDRNNGQGQDIITFKGGKIGGTELLRVGDTIEYFSDENRTVSYIKAGDTGYRRITGTIRRTESSDDKASVTIYDYTGRSHKFDLAPYAKLNINNRPTELKNFVYGMDVVARIHGGTLTVLDGESYAEEIGYIPPLSKMRIGKIQSISGNSLVLSNISGRLEEITFDSDTVVTYNSGLSSPKALKVGLDIKAYFDDQTNLATKLEIEKPEEPFDNIYVGKLENLIQTSKTVNIIGINRNSKPKMIDNSRWKDTDTYSLNLKYDVDSKFYKGNESISPKDIRRKYPHSEVYAVVKKVFGTPTIVNLTLKNGGENTVSSIITQIDKQSKEFELRTRENFNITDGTIVVKDGVVVPYNQLKAGDNVFVVSSRKGAESKRDAMVVKVTSDKADIFNGVKIGVLDTVNPNNIVFNNFADIGLNPIKINPQKSQPYHLYNTSVITDLTNEPPKLLNPELIWHGRYSLLETKDPKHIRGSKSLMYKRYYAFAVTNPEDNSIIAMNIRKKGIIKGQKLDDTLKSEDDISKALENTFSNVRFTKGIVASKDSTWGRFEITDGHDYTNLTNRWTPNGANVFIKYTDAIIVKNNVVISHNDIKLGDELHIMRLGADSLVIIVE